MKSVLKWLLLGAACSLSAAEYTADTQTPLRIPYAQDLHEEMLYYVFDWGDGTVSPSSIKRSGVYGFMEHQYTKRGTYEGRFRAISIGGHQSD